MSLCHILKNSHTLQGSENQGLIKQNFVEFTETYLTHVGE